MKKVFLGLSVICFVFCYGCSLAPLYYRPEMIVPENYKEAGEWIEADASYATLEKEPWWQMYNDPVLNSLEDSLTIGNQDLQIYLARYDQARALVNVARSAYYPSVSGVANASRQKLSKSVANVATHTEYDDELVGLNVSYEIDAWGSVRNSVRAAKSTAAASYVDVAAIELSLRAQLASTYFSLRGDDASQKILDETVQVYQRALKLTQERYKGGAVSVLDVDQAQTQLETAKTLAADMRLQRGQLEHAIAVLIGVSPATFNLPASTEKPTLVTVAPNLPSKLLEQRPDIVKTELLVQAANANIGVARAAFFPSFNLTGGIGFDSQTLDKLLEAPSLLWALGPSSVVTVFNNTSAPFISQTIFDGGRLKALSDQAWANYFETVAIYRQTVLTAFQEVEDNLIAIRELDNESKTQKKAAIAADRALKQEMYRYKGGLITYLDVVVTQNTALQAELSLVNIHTRRQLASIGLIKALGGGWADCNLELVRS